eukprot:SAG31_NODE_44116_length_264_cov_0.630303_1_plen_29_part_10
MVCAGGAIGAASAEKAPKKTHDLHYLLNL